MDIELRKKSKRNVMYKNGIKKCKIKKKELRKCHAEK
jgi:hypothetical protein